MDILEKHFKIIPRVVYNIGCNDIGNSKSHIYYFDGSQPLNKICQEQTLEPPELINIVMDKLILVPFLTFSHLMVKQCVYLILKENDEDITNFLNNIGFTQFFNDNNNYGFVNMRRTNIIYNSLN
jgi:hypothetical protein